MPQHLIKSHCYMKHGWFLFHTLHRKPLQDAPPLKFAIFFAGALIRDRNLSYIYREKVTLPSIHIIGDRDYVKEV